LHVVLYNVAVLRFVGMKYFHWH